MKLPSVSQIFDGAYRTLFRFPLVLCCALLGTVSAVILVDYEGPQRATVFFKILLPSVVGIPLLLGLKLIAEKMRWGGWGLLALNLTGIVLLIGYALTVPSTLSFGPFYHIQRLMVLTVAMYLFVAVAPFLNPEEQNGFWQYNKILLFRFLGAAVYSNVLYLGLCLAIAALDQLFGINILPKRYGELWIVIFGILNTWLFLSGVPKDLKSLDQLTEYPKSFSILVEFVLAPLALIYVILVYAYTVKIIFTWGWSNGWISKLILGFATTGMLSVILLYPIRDRENVRWVQAIFRWFFVAMIPLIVELPLAVWRRVSEFGMTEARYIAAALAVWLIGIIAYLALSRGKNIKIIPLSLGVFALAICYGPWSMFHISEQSQLRRLRGLLERDSILVAGVVHKAPAPVRQEDARQVSSLLLYLHQYHGLGMIQPWFRVDLRKDTTSALSEWKEPALVAKLMGVDFVMLQPGGGENLVTFTMEQEVSTEVRGYDRMIRFSFIGEKGLTKELPEEGTTFDVNATLDTLKVGSKSVANKRRSLVVCFRPLVDTLLSFYGNETVTNVPRERMTLTGETDGLQAKVFLRNLQIRRNGQAKQIQFLSIDVVYTK